MNTKVVKNLLAHAWGWWAKKIDSHSSQFLTHVCYALHIRRSFPLSLLWKPLIWPQVPSTLRRMNPVRWYEPSLFIRYSQGRCSSAPRLTPFQDIILLIYCAEWDLHFITRKVEKTQRSIDIEDVKCSSYRSVWKRLSWLARGRWFLMSQVASFNSQIIPILIEWVGRLYCWNIVKNEATAVRKFLR